MSNETSTVAVAEADGGYARIAHPVHTIILLTGLAVWAYFSAIRAVHMRDAVDVNRLYMYSRTMIFEWLTVGYVALGVRWNGSSLATVFGERWRSIREMGRDLGIGALFLVVPVAIGVIFGGHGHGSVPDRSVLYLLPVTGIERSLWIALSLTAGICEEVVNRGYLQRQFTALTGNVGVAVVLQGIVFGSMHSYQGVRKAIPIAVLGIALGVLAHWRKSVRPGMVEHALQDMMALFVKR
jgi:membrane protease YdiL (CAAX protease family)